MCDHEIPACPHHTLPRRTNNNLSSDMHEALDDRVMVNAAVLWDSDAKEDDS